MTGVQTCALPISGLYVRFNLGCGSNYLGTANTWLASNTVAPTGSTSVVGTNGATWYLTGVQLEAGSSATSFEWRPYTTELQLCQRYYVGSLATTSGSMLGYGVGTSTTNVDAAVITPVTMRATPSMSVTASARCRGNGANNTPTAVTVNSALAANVYVSYTCASTTTYFTYVILD